MSLFLLILFFFLFYPLFKVGWAIFKARRQARKLYEQFAQGFAGANAQNGSPKQSPKPEKRKKIDPSVGEYVEFEEISVYHSETQTIESSDGIRTETKFKAESQIVDVEWEDIK